VMAKNTKENPTNFSKLGTGAIMEKYEAMGNLPIRNFQGGIFPGVKNIAPSRMLEDGYIDKMDGCFGCPVKCKRRMKAITEPWPVNPVYGGPEYETLGVLGSNCDIDNLEAIMKGHEICNRFGMDTISAGMTVSFAMECFENGILTEKDTDGIQLKFGNAEAMIEMLERMALRKGFGDVLAEGSKKASEIIGKGSEKFAMQVKGSEIPMHEPRFKQGLGLHYTGNASGPDHCSGIHDNLLDASMAARERIDVAESVPPTELSPRKVRILYQFGMWRQATNSLGMCNFVPWSQKQLTDALEYITGWPMSYWRIMKTTERGMTMARIFNMREGFSAKDDKLPARFNTSPAEGPLQGIAINPEQMAEAQKLYYQMLGWDESGTPTFARLVELDMEWAREYLNQYKKE
ncbi:aldehyde ferredoxin oxidoreductase C-terminal domain-containing protein, partial [Thermodesulfobacteriota bacterium]